MFKRKEKQNQEAHRDILKIGDCPKTQLTFSFIYDEQMDIIKTELFYASINIKQEFHHLHFSHADDCC